MLGNLIPMLGNFHLVKAAEHWQILKRKSYRNRDIWNKSRRVRTGRNSLRGLLIMQWEAFWQSRDRSHYADILCCLNDFLGALQEKDPSTSKSSLEKCLERITPVKDEFERFCHLVGETSQCVVIGIVFSEIPKDLISADRWLLYLC